MYTCFEVADYFLMRQDVEAGDMMSNMKLQKLVYYAHGFYLAYTGNPLFIEPIMAWDHGPVCVPLYKKYKGYKAKPLPIPSNDDVIDKFDPETQTILDKVHNRYGQYSASKLRNLSHTDYPWLIAFCHKRAKITDDVMIEYFKNKINEDIKADVYETKTIEPGEGMYICNIDMDSDLVKELIRREEEFEKEFDFGPIDDESL